MRLPGLALALLSSWLCVAREGACQHYYALRPAPSDALPLVELHEDPDPALDPGERDLNETELRRTLGHLDARYLSASPPEERERAGGSGDTHAGPREDEEEEDEEEEGERRSSRRRRRKKKKKRPHAPQQRRKRRRRPWERALCPVAHAWSDLGARFWPRYVRMGSCSRERSCSVPAGMRCAPAASTHVTLLRWRCARRGTLRCAWIRVHYPVITACKCTCASS